MIEQTVNIYVAIPTDSKGKHIRVLVKREGTT